jgi:hypothetical protein
LTALAPALGILVREKPMPDRSITDLRAKRLWWQAGERCSFPGCEQLLVEQTKAGDEGTVVGEECHIVARRDSPTVARSPRSAQR